MDPGDDDDGGVVGECDIDGYGLMVTVMVMDWWWWTDGNSNGDGDGEDILGWSWSRAYHHWADHPGQIRPWTGTGKDDCDDFKVDLANV